MRYLTAIGIAALLVGGSAATIPAATPRTQSTLGGSSAPLARGRHPLRQSTPSGKDYIFVSNDTQFGRGGTAEIDYWPVGTSGNVAPTVIGGSRTGLFYGLEGLVVDSTGQVLVNSSFTAAILGFPANASGNVSPSTNISGSNTTLVQPIGLAIDANDNLYVSDCGSGCANGENGPGSVDVFAAGSNGNIAPLRRIVGSQTTLVAPFGIAYRDGNIYVADIAEQPPLRARRGHGEPQTPAFAIDVFAADANGNVKPRRRITGGSSQLNQPLGIAVDSHGIYTVVWEPSAIQRFDLHAKGDVPPRATIQGSRTGLNCCLDGIITAPDRTVYVVERGTPEIAQFPALRKGRRPPLSVISGSNTRLYIPLFVYVGTEPTPGRPVTRPRRGIPNT